MSEKLCMLLIYKFILQYVFYQLVEILDEDKFRHLVDKYNGKRYVKSFTCWNQLFALM